MSAGHSRYPVLAAADLARPVSTIMKPAVVVPTLMTLPALLDELIEHRVQLACVVDEFGGFAGIIPGAFHLDEVERTIDHRLPEPETAGVARLTRLACRMSADTPVHTALTRMRETGNQLALVTEDGKVAGVVTIIGILRHLFPRAEGGRTAAAAR